MILGTQSGNTLLKCSIWTQIPKAGTLLPVVSELSTLENQTKNGAPIGHLCGTGNNSRTDFTY